MASADGPRGSRRPSCRAGTAVTVTDPMRTLLPWGQLGDGAEILLRGQAAGARRHHEVRITRKASERGKVEVIPVEMRDEHSVERGERGPVDRLGDADEVGDAAPQHRVREQPHPGQLEEHGGVPEPRDPVREGLAHGRLPPCDRSRGRLTRSRWEAPQCATRHALQRRAASGGRPVGRPEVCEQRRA